uniref:Uncharacterized protein n=1 Tax=Rhizophora mucronata TaxID=61149 RepID=A0A2P2QHU4_RHIMU
MESSQRYIVPFFSYCELHGNELTKADEGKCCQETVQLKSLNC